MPKRTRDYRPWLLGKLTHPQTAADYLNEAMNDSPEMFLKALRNIAQARQMATVARQAGVQRESLYRTLSKRGNPRLDTLNAVLRVLGLRIAIQADASRSTRRAARENSQSTPTKLAREV
ncbi:MAG: addiction module antidote protein [Terriglobia bacterium]